MNAIAHPTAKLPVREKLAYGLGDFASNLIFGTLSAFLMFYYTDIFGLSAAAVGTLLFVARATDAVWNIYLGTLVDRTRTRWGQCRPYLVFGAPVLALCTMLLSLCRLAAMGTSWPLRTSPTPY